MPLYSTFILSPLGYTNSHFNSHPHTIEISISSSIVKFPRFIFWLNACGDLLTLFSRASSISTVGREAQPHLACSYPPT